MRTDLHKFWSERAKGYDRLEWAARSSYLHHFLNSDRFRSDDLVLDVGTGTGIIAHSLAPIVKKVVAIDMSEDMLSRSGPIGVNHNQVFLQADVRNLCFKDKTFTKVTARMVFHHIIEGMQEAMSECFRVLKKGGDMILSEGVPPDIRIKDWYTAMFKLKEERLTFMEEDLVRLITCTDFDCVVEISTFIAKKCSVRNWLGNSGLPSAKQKVIYKMHLELPDHGKEAYNLVELPNDILIDMKFVTVAAKKK